MQGVQSAEAVLSYRYRGNFERFGGVAPDIIYDGYGQAGKDTARGLEQRTFERFEGIGADGKRANGSVWSRENAKTANLQNPVGEGNGRRTTYLSAADGHLNRGATPPKRSMLIVTYAKGNT
jgi:hypothetical protein